MEKQKVWLVVTIIELLIIILLGLTLLNCQDNPNVRFEYREVVKEPTFELCSEILINETIMMKQRMYDLGVINREYLGMK